MILFYLLVLGVVFFGIPLLSLWLIDSSRRRREAGDGATDLLRADSAQAGPGWDPKAAIRAVWDVFDRTAGKR